MATAVEQNQIATTASNYVDVWMKCFKMNNISTRPSQYDNTQIWHMIQKLLQENVVNPHLSQSQKIIKADYFHNKHRICDVKY